MTEYPIIITPLTQEDGGGYLGFVPDLAGCMSDGETPEEALANTREAIGEWLDSARRRNMKIPAPHSAAARARSEREMLVAQLREAAKNINDMDDRLCAIEDVIREIEERLDHEDAWRRFSDIAGLPVDHRGKVRHSA